MVKLDKRLSAILNEVCCETLLDIGCDHGKISVMSVLKGKAKFVIAADISPKSLEKTVILAKKCGVDDLVNAIESDGFKSINLPFDQVVIAGMGGYEIVKILKNTDYRGKMILVPHQDADVLRMYINKSFAVKKDFIVKSAKKYYSIIVLDKGSYQYDKTELSFGFIDKDNPDFVEMMAEKRSKLKKYADKSLKLKEIYDEVDALCQKLKI